MLEDIVIDTPVDRPHSSGQTASQTAGRASSQPLRVAVLWKTPNLGLYSNAAFDDLYNGIGHNNGNLAFVHSICSHIANPVKHFSWGSSAETLRNNADIIVIPCANQLGRHTDYGQMAENLEKSGLPIVAIGLGAQANSYDHDIELSPGTLRWAQVIAASNPASATSPNIYTRGAYTTAQLDKLGITGSLPGGCPSHFLNQAPGLGRKIHANWSALDLPRSITVAGGHQAWAKTREIEHQLIALMMDPIAPGQYIVQSMGEMIRASRGLFDGIDPHALKEIHRHTVPHYSFEEFKVWCRNYMRSYYDVPAWMDTLRQQDLTIGCRYHGVALAIQAERMGLTVTIDSRTRELCENTGVPYADAADLTMPLTRSRLKSLINFDPDAYDRHRAESAARYLDFLVANRLQPAPFLKSIANGK
ncbi:polysaccharide pyruvyl transferase family protein [Azospirillum sp. TSA2s]|uniref:polysaccharide pyruvyl transferase family protein n=1 Tax=Azospirillum sp. TSA2s TaxID=709810 RepID=UPI0010AA8FB4|nr:polysaccharide pyruvyl transferase family protein [Azospirillum sp. TSA2s]QCG93426.1 polysaccharide pyruvyl transferase family protein [Azospirillum sp. TSA2s]